MRDSSDSECILEFWNLFEMEIPNPEFNLEFQLEFKVLKIIIWRVFIIFCLFPNVLCSRKGQKGQEAVQVCKGKKVSIRHQPTQQ